MSEENQKNHRTKILAGSSNQPLAQAVCNFLKCPLAKISLRRFADTETFIEIEENVRGQEVFFLQSTSRPANDHLIELLLALDALRRGSARCLTAVIPYYGYARQDRKTGPRTPISAKMVANLLTTAGADRVLTMDLHAGQIQGFFDIPTDNLFAAPVFIQDIVKRIGRQNLTLVSPDAGGAARARALAKKLGGTLAIIDKRREHPGVSEVAHIIGEVENRLCILVDDIADSAGTLCNAAEAVHQAGGKCIWAYATHGVLSPPALERIAAAPLIDLTVTDTICLPPEIQANKKIRQISIAPLLAEAIARIGTDRSVSSLFQAPVF